MQQLSQNTQDPGHPKFKAKQTLNFKTPVGGSGVILGPITSSSHPQNPTSFRKVKKTKQKNKTKWAVLLSGCIRELFPVKSENILLPTSPWCVWGEVPKTWDSPQVPGVLLHQRGRGGGVPPARPNPPTPGKSEGPAHS